MAITEEESLIELASLLKGGHDKEIIDEKEMKKFIEAVREKEEEEDSPPVNGAEVMCVYAEDQTKPVKVKKLEGDISIGGKAQLNSRDIEIDPNDNSEAKKYQTVTIGIGLSFNNGGDNWDVLRDILGWTDDDIREIIRRIYSGQDKDFVYKEERRFLEDPKYKITEKQAKKLLVTAAMRKYMPNLNRTIEENNKKKGKAATYYQEQLEAMFDVSYNQGVSPEKVYDPDSIIPYYLTGNQKGAVNAVTSFGKDRSRRRLNQMKLFFIKSYEFENYNDGSKEFDPLRAELGFKVE